MPTEQLILRRVFPVPVTFADLRRAAMTANPFPPFWIGPWSSMYKSECKRPEHGCHAQLADVRTWWHAAIKEATGALDEVYAVIDGHEVRVATVDKARATIDMRPESNIGRAFNDLLIKADEAGYWQRPHEVRHVIEETVMSTRIRDRIALNSFAVAVATEWTDALIVAAGDDK